MSTKLAIEDRVTLTTPPPSRRTSTGKVRSAAPEPAGLSRETAAYRLTLSAAALGASRQQGAMAPAGTEAKPAPTAAPSPTLGARFLRSVGRLLLGHEAMESLRRPTSPSGDHQ